MTREFIRYPEKKWTCQICRNIFPLKSRKNHMRTIVFVKGLAVCKYKKGHPRYRKAKKKC